MSNFDNLTTISVKWWTNKSKGIANVEYGNEFDQGFVLEDL